MLKRLRTDKSDAEDHVPAPASRTSAASAVQQSEQEACDNPPVKAVKQDQAGPSDPHTVAQEPTANDGAHVDQEPAAHPASEQEPSTGPCSGQSPTANEAASSRDAQPQQPCNNRVLLEPHLLYVLLKAFLVSYISSINGTIPGTVADKVSMNVQAAAVCRALEKSAPTARPAGSEPSSAAL